MKFFENYGSKIVKKIFAVLLSLFATTVFVHAESNEDKAKTYCKDMEAKGVACKADKIYGCGIGWIHHKSFRGKGKDWHVCLKKNISKKDKELSKMPIIGNVIYDTAYKKTASLNEAEAYCKGKSMRLPTVDELLAAYNSKHHVLKYHERGSTYAQYRTSNVSGVKRYKYQTVDFSNGKVQGRQSEAGALVRCVRDK
jgi:hypothetical protein